MATLMRPHVRLWRSYAEAMTEIGNEVPADPAAHVAELLRRADEDAPRPEGWVPSTVLWWAEGDEYLGRLSIRHRLTEALRKVGGHIGYDVRPSARRRGHATAMLRAALPIACELGIERALVTCDVDNVASRKVIEASGGVLFEADENKLRFWGPTRRPGCPFLVLESGD